MRKLSSAVKENMGILAVTAAVILLAVLNLMLPDKNGGENRPEAGITAAEEISGEREIIISELMIKNRAVIRDEDGDFPDWIELSNISERDINLGGWSMADREGKEAWAFPDVSIPAGQQLIVFASGKDRGLHTDFSLSSGDEVILYDKEGRTAAEVSCRETEADVSLCRDDKGEYKESLYPTPGYKNDAYDIMQAEIKTESPLIINEVQTANLSPSGIEEPESYDWVELKNISGETVTLSDWYLSDDNDELLKWQLPEGGLAPGELMLIYCEEKPESEISDKLICDEFSLNSQSEQLYLSKGEELKDYVSLRDIPYLCSYGRVSGEGGWFFMAEPTPGEENGEGFRRVSAAPEVISGEGISEGADSVSVELKAPGRIYYTTDGSVPDESSSLYTSPIKISSTGIIRAIVAEEGAMPSRVRDISSIINEGHSLPVLSLVADDTQQFNAMYDGGLKGMEIPGSLSFFEEGGSFNIHCGIKIHGETSRSLPKKNMSVRFRGAYGESGLDYDVYGGGVTEFKNFVLRAGQDFYSGIVRNEFCQNLALAASDSLVSQRSRYCVLYINGRYSGIYNLMEKPNEQLYAALAEVSRDSVTVIESEAEYGSEFYNDVIAFCQENDMRLAENYEHFCKIVDVDSLIDWVIMQGYSANMDLTYGNLRYCRSTENDGRWRFMFYDLDSSFYNEANCFDVLSGFSLSTRQVGLIIRPLLDNESFRERFLSRAGELLSTALSTENVLEELDRLCMEIAPEVERDYSRFGMSYDKWEWNVDFIKSLLEDDKWNKTAVDRLCDIFRVDAEEREKYFG